MSATLRMNRRTGTKAVVLACASVACALLVMPGLAGAKRPAAVESDPALNVQQADPQLGDYVTFDVTYPSDVRYPRVAVRCYGSDGALTYAEAGAYDHSFLLGGAASDWLRIGGPASCTGELFYFVSKGSRPQQAITLAWTSFGAAG